MAYQSLYRRYRPQRFAEVRGQEHLVKALRNAVVEERVGHAYLFSGPRGTGKTSTARILAKVLNCDAPVDGEPCGTCPSCVAIEAGTSFDVHELDAASNNGVEAIRDLINKASLGTPGRTKVYILDEVHMLTAGASNALLKTLEEPPDHVVFVLATTDPQKVLPTIKSRTQHFEVHLLGGDDLAGLVDDIVADAGLQIDADARDYVLRVGAGSARDTLSALERVAAAGGVPDDGGAIDELVDALCDRDTARALVAVEQATNTGRSPRAVAEELIGRVRDVFLAAVQADLGRLADHERDRVREQASRLGAAGATRALDVLGEVFVGSKDAPDPRVLLEVALVRLTHADADRSLDAILDRLERLEHGMATAPAAPAGPVATRAPTPAPTASAAAADPSDGEAAPDSAAEVADDAGSSPGTPPSEDGAGRPADEARRRLAKTKERTARPAAVGGARPAGKTPAAPPAKAKAKAPAVARGASAAAAEQPPPPDRSASEVTGAERAPASGPIDVGSLPDRDDLTIAWADEVLPALTQRVRNRASGGRWLEVTSAGAVFGLPSAPSVERFADVVPAVEQALAAWHGSPVPVRVVLVAPDAGAAPAGRVGPAEPEEGSADPIDELADFDPAELEDAADAGATQLDRVVDVFPGAELVDDEG